VLPIIAVAVVLLLTLGGIVGFLLTRSNGDEEFSLAEQDYQAKAYNAEVQSLRHLENFGQPQSGHRSSAHGDGESWPPRRARQLHRHAAGREGFAF
jgi:hypothetical protein